LEQVIRGTDAKAPDSKSVWKREFGMVLMGAIEMEILHTVGRFNLSRLFLSQTSTSRKVTCFCEKDQVKFTGKGAVEVLQKYFQRQLSVGPDQENIVDIEKPGERFEKCGVEVLGLQASHEKVGVGRGHANANGYAFDLQEIVVLKGEVVHGEDKLG